MQLIETVRALAPADYVDPWSRAAAADRCRACGEHTWERKPYCSRHVGLNPHAARVLAELAARELDLGRVIELGPEGVDLSGPWARDVLRYLAVEGGATLPGLARQLALPVDAVRAYAAALASAGALYAARGSRGDTLHLTGAGEAAA